jgi:hypothetical protein
VAPHRKRAEKTTPATKRPWFIDIWLGRLIRERSSPAIYKVAKRQQKKRVR